LRTLGIPNPDLNLILPLNLTPNPNHNPNPKHLKKRWARNAVLLKGQGVRNGWRPF